MLESFCHQIETNYGEESTKLGQVGGCFPSLVSSFLGFVSHSGGGERCDGHRDHTSADVAGVVGQESADHWDIF